MAAKLVVISTTTPATFAPAILRYFFGRPLRDSALTWSYRQKKRPVKQKLKVTVVILKGSVVRCDNFGGARFATLRMCWQFYYCFSAVLNYYKGCGGKEVVMSHCKDNV